MTRGSNDQVEVPTELLVHYIILEAPTDQLEAPKSYCACPPWEARIPLLVINIPSKIRYQRKGGGERLE